MCDKLASVNNCSEGIGRGITKRAPHYYVIAYWEPNRNDNIIDSDLDPTNKIDSITIKNQPIKHDYIKTPEGSVLI